jgi:hypothetical protein
MGLLVWCAETGQLCLRLVPPGAVCCWSYCSGSTGAAAGVLCWFGCTWCGVPSPGDGGVPSPCATYSVCMCVHMDLAGGASFTASLHPCPCVSRRPVQQPPVVSCSPASVLLELVRLLAVGACELCVHTLPGGQLLAIGMHMSCVVVGCSCCQLDCIPSHGH